MAVTTAICNSFKQECLDGVHLAADTYKIALIKNGATGTYDKTLTNVGTPGTGAPSTSNLGTDEASGTGYTSNGATLAGRTSGLSGDTGYVDWNDAVWDPSSLSAIGAIIYNSTRSNKAVMVISFADTVSVPVVSSNAAFTVQIPSSGTGQVRLT
jgi:hypothetical protein